MLPDGLEILLRVKKSPFLITNIKGNIFEVNHAFLKLTGYKKKELLQKMLSDITAGSEEELNKNLNMFSSSAQWSVGAISLKKANGEIEKFPCMGLTLTKNEKPQERYIGIELENQSQFNILNQKINDLNKEIHDKNKIEMELLHVNRELISSENRWKFLVKSVQAGVVIHAPDTTIVMSNQEAQTILGLTENQMLGKTTMDPEWKFVNSDGSAMELKDYPANKVASTGKPLRNYLVGIQRKDRSYITWVLLNGIPLRNKKKQIEEIVIAFMEITELRQKEEMLRFTEFAIENSGEAMFWVTSDAKFIRINQKACEVLGYSRTELLTKTVHDIDPEFPREKWNEFWNEMKKSKHLQMESQHKKKNGLIFPIDLLVNYFEYENEQYVLATVRDISKKKETEKELNTIRHYLQNLFDSLPSVLIGVDVNTNITQWNKAAESFVAKKFNEVQGKSVVNVLPILKDSLKSIQQSVLQKKSMVLDNVSYTEGKNSHYYNIAIYPLTQNEISGAVIRLDDITEKTRMERMMIQTEKMLSVGGLAAGMAHELNNPIGGIMMGIQNIQRRLSPDFSGNMETAQKFDLDLTNVVSFLEDRGIPDFLESMMDAGKRSAAIVSNMLLFARKPEMKMTRKDLNEIINKSLELAKVDYDMKKKYDFRNIEIVSKLQDDIPHVICIASEIQQVILNLLRNAAQALLIGKRRALPRITLKSYYKDNVVFFEIEDNGPGIDLETKNHIFEPFFTTRPVGEGTGLGLSVSYFIIHEEHGGSITVESIPEKFTMFRVALPVKQ